MNKVKMLVVILLILAAGGTYAWACQGPCTGDPGPDCDLACCNAYNQFSFGCSLQPCEEGCCDTCNCGAGYCG